MSNSCDPMDSSLACSSVLGISQARILERVAISFSSWFSWPRDWTCVSCIGRQVLHHKTTSKAHLYECCSVAQSCLALWDPMDCSTVPVLHYLPEFAQTHVYWVDDAIQPPHSLLPPSPIFCLSQHQDLFQWVGSSHPVDKVLELQHQSFQWIFRMNNGIVTCIIIRESSFVLFLITKAWLHSLSHPCFRRAFSAVVEASGAGYSGWWSPLVRGTLSVLFFQLGRKLGVAEWDAFLIVLGTFSRYSISL